jgi:hypothetical protein
MVLRFYTSKWRGIVSYFSSIRGSAWRKSCRKNRLRGESRPSDYLLDELAGELQQN